MSAERAIRPNGVARRIAFVFVTLVWTAVGEEFPAGGWRAWFGEEILTVPAHYLYIAGTTVLLAPFVLAAPKWSLTAALKQVGVWRWVVVGWFAIIIALLVAILTAAPNPFADWRNLLLVGVVAALAGRWLAAEGWISRVLTDLAIGYGLVSWVYLASWVAGGGATVFGIRTPSFYGPILYMAGFASITLLLAWATASRHPLPRFYGLLVRLGAISSTLMVLLSFRRSFWLAWAIGMVGVFYLLIRSRWSNPRGVLSFAVALVAGLLFAFVSLGSENIATRLESFLPGADNRFAATNEDHVNDIVDAWAVISEDPVLGYGIGRFYPTELIAEWKTESFEVHNAFLHVWLKYGVLGLVGYVGFHIAWIRWLWRARRADELPAPSLAALALFLGGETAATIVGTWPYGSTHMAIFHGVLLASTAVLATGSSRSQTTDEMWIAPPVSVVRPGI